MNVTITKIFPFPIVESKTSTIFATANRNNSGYSSLYSKIGSVVQLVRIHACHAWGRGFESRPNRKNTVFHLKYSVFLSLNQCLATNRLQSTREWQFFCISWRLFLFFLFPVLGNAFPVTFLKKRLKAAISSNPRIEPISFALLLV